MTFEEWFKNYINETDSIVDSHGKAVFRSLWDYQQSIIDEKQKRIERLEGALEGIAEHGEAWEAQVAHEALKEE